MGELSLNDMVVAPDGRVVIANPEIAARISAMKTDPADPTVQRRQSPATAEGATPTSNARLVGLTGGCTPTRRGVRWRQERKDEAERHFLGSSIEVRPGQHCRTAFSENCVRR